MFLFIRNVIYTRARPSHYLRGIHARGEKKPKTNMQVSLLEYIRGYTFTKATNLASPRIGIACQKSIHRTVEAINSHQYAHI